MAHDIHANTPTNTLANPVQILTVSELNRLAREVLEGTFPLFWVSGEVSNFTRAASGHWYFSLKDSTAQVKCVMFKGRNAYTDFILREGDHIDARATVTLYEARGDFQLTIEFVQKAGLGALFESFEQLKNKLQKEGLFDASNKQLIPRFAQTIGIVTSVDAAALRDVLATLKRRNPNIKVIIYSTPVQGKGAAQTIASAINTANARNEVDILIVCRGGGSMEDLWQFNEEVVARALANCMIPTISGVGHETDFTICDFVADVRAPTPTAAAELASQDLTVLKRQILNISQLIAKKMAFELQQRAQRLDYLAQRLISPMQQVAQKQLQLANTSARLSLQMLQPLQAQEQRLNLLQQSLQHLNPHAVLTRGYAIVQNAAGVVRNSQQLKVGDDLRLTFGVGAAEAKITQRD